MRPLLKPKMFIVGWAKRRPEDLIECRPTFYKVSREKVTQKKTIKKACFVIAVVYILLEIVALLILALFKKIRGLCLMKLASETLQNLPYFWNKNTQILDFAKIQNEIKKTMWGFLIQKIWPILKNFTRTISSSIILFISEEFLQQ